MTDPKQKSAEEMARYYVDSHPFTLAGFTRPEVELIQSAYRAAFLAGWHARDEEVAAKDKRIEAQLCRWEVSEAKFVTTREADIVKERDRLRAEVTALRGVAKAAEQSARWLNGIEYELEARVYTLTADEFETVFSARDNIYLALAQLPQASDGEGSGK